MKKWQGLVCGYFYDQALGVPDEGLPAGTPWDHVPESWTCRDCGAPNSDFQMAEI